MRTISILMLLTAAAASGAEPVTVLRFGKLIDGRGGVINDAVVVVGGNRIASVGGAVPAGATEIDLRQYTAIPGLIDAHTHMTFYWGENQAPTLPAPAEAGSAGPA